jgi:hypothetical protein
MSNQFEATCTYCKKAVAPGKGVVKKVGKRYNVRHPECVGKVPAPTVTKLEEGQWRVKKDKG